MKDFYDVWFLATRFAFDGQRLSEAVRNTFSRRRTAVPGAYPLALTDEFANDGAKTLQWKGFVAKGKLMDRFIDLREVVSRIRDFLGPVLNALSQGAAFAGTWHPDGSWQ